MSNDNTYLGELESKATRAEELEAMIAPPMKALKHTAEHMPRIWKGRRSKPEERRLVAHWLPPTIVASDTAEDIVPTIRPVGTIT